MQQKNLKYKVRKVNESPGSIMRAWEVYVDEKTTIASIPGYYKEGEAIANGIAYLLNKDLIVIPLEI
jgi:hypothetical protein